MMAIFDFREIYLRPHDQINQTLKVREEAFLSQHRFENPYGRWDRIPFICYWIHIDFIREWINMHMSKMMLLLTAIRK